jgi:hypothetical protein
VLSGTARKLVAGFLVLGVLTAVGIGVTEAVVFGKAVNTINATNAADQVQADSGPVSSAIDNYAANVKSCNGKLECVTKLDRQVAATLSTFAGQLRAIKMPSQATAANAALASSVSRTASIFARLGAATTASQYISEASAANLNQALNQVNTDYGHLGTALGS